MTAAVDHYARNDGAAGVTVKAPINNRLVGEALHRLEYHIEIDLVERRRPLCETPANPQPHEVWILRSRRFPRAWEGRIINLIASTDINGFVEFELVGADGPGGWD